MGHMKDFDRRIRQGGDDAIAAVSEYVESLHNELARQSRLMHDARIMLVGSPVGSGCYEAFRLLNEEPSPWIPVSERLPEIGVSVLCSSKEPPGEDWVWIGQREQYEWYFPGANEMGTPTHWMPLPEPPEVK
jgi:hypothetical protein